MSDEVVTVPRALLRDACNQLYDAGEDIVRKQLDAFAYPDDLRQRVDQVAAMPDMYDQQPNPAAREYVRGYNNAMRSARRILGKPRAGEEEVINERDSALRREPISDLD